MTWNNKGIIAKVYNLSTPELIKGSDLSITTQIVNSGTNEAYPIKNYVGSTGYFPNEDGTAKVIIGELMSAFQGVVKFAIPASGSVDLKAGEEISFEQHLSDSSGLTILQLNESLIIKDRLF